MMLSRTLTRVALVTLLFSAPAGAQILLDVHVVVPAVSDFGNGTLTGTLAITGQAFGSVAPFVYLGTTPLAVLAASQTSLVVQIPDGTTPGSYQLTVIRKKGLPGLDIFEVALGAGGPAGSEGPPGPIGPPGDAGPAGADGAAGAAGPAGVRGPMGVQGPEGVPGYNGSIDLARIYVVEASGPSSSMVACTDPADRAIAVHAKCGATAIRDALYYTKVFDNEGYAECRGVEPPDVITFTIPHIIQVVCVKP